MPRIDDLLDAEGARWRAEVDARRSPRPAAAPGRRMSRRTLAWSSGALGAAAVVAVALAVPWSTGGHSPASSDAAGGAVAHSAAGLAETNGSAANAAPRAASRPARGMVCPGEHLTATSVGPVRAGAAITLHGARYGLVHCAGASSPGSRQGGSPRVVLRLTTADHRTTVVASETPQRAGGSFTARVVVPASAPAGPAVIRDGRGHVVRFEVTR